MQIQTLSADQLSRLIPLFSHTESHHIAISCCQGLVPCRAFADDADHPTAAIVVLERFGIAFAAGNAAHAPELLEQLRGWHPWYEINEPPVDWYPALADWSKAGHATVRYLFSTDPAQFSLDALRKLATPPEGTSIVPFNADLLAQALTATWSEDQTGAFLTPDDFMKDGFGMALVKDGKLVAGCSSFCRHEDGYEIQVDTHPDMRGKGYATAISAAFILNALERGLVPCWDAANATSFRLARRLGYTFVRLCPAWILVAPSQDVEAVQAKVVG